MKRRPERTIVPSLFQQDTGIDLHPRLNLNIVEWSNDTVLFFNAERIAIDQDQQVNVAIRTGIASRFTSVEDSFSVRSYLRQSFSYAFYYLQSSHFYYAVLV